jgi:membrane protein DedA with SNARE-associated domain
MEDIISSISTYGYVIIFFYSFGGGFFALMGGAILASMGELNIAYVVLLAGISNMLGDLFLFYIGKYHKREVSKYQFFIKHRRKMAYSKVLIKKYATLAIFIQKYIYGVKTIIPVILGISNYNFLKFATLNLFSSIIFATLIGFGTFYSSSYIRAFFDEHQINPIFLPIIIITLLFFVWKYIEKQTAK